MAIIKCKECDKEYSNKAGKCPACGCPTIYNDEIKCKECGEYYTAVEGKCLSCGCPTDYNTESTAQSNILETDAFTNTRTKEFDKDYLDEILKYRNYIIPIIIINVVFSLIGQINGVIMGLAVVLLISTGYISGKLYYMISSDKAMSTILGAVSAFGLIGIIPVLYIAAKTDEYLKEFS